MTDQETITAGFTNGPFTRVYLGRAQADAFIARYVEQFDGELMYDFEFEKIKARIIAIGSDHGAVSVLFTDHYKELPDYSKNTKAMYIGDIRKVLERARAADLNILQDYTETPGGAQGRVEIVPGFNIEIIELSAELKAPA